jgi:pyridoxal phosphate enzyme (YggS family)
LEIDVCKRIVEIRRRIEEAAEQSNRNFKDIILVAAVKGIDNKRVEEALGCGVDILGENKVQEAVKRHSQFAVEIGETFPEWHMIGHLQRNKVKKACEIFDMIQSLDSLPLAREVNQKAILLDKRIKILVEVNTSGEKTKYGIQPDPDSLLNFVEEIVGLNGLRFMGLMTLGPYSEDQDTVRRAFRRLKSLGMDLRDRGYETPVLSMGMTHDFDIAIEEGSTMVRIGTGIFGERDH